MPDSYDPLATPLVRRKTAFKLLGVSNTLGNKMLNDGRLTRVRLSARRVMVTSESIRRLIAGSAALPPRSRPHRAAPKPESTPDDPVPRLIKRPRS